MRNCANPECTKQFSPKSHNQKYHNAECCRQVTNKRIMDKYYENKEVRGGKRRACGTNGCETVLSRYNPTPVCSVCDAKEDAYGIALLGMLK